jgi:hypothetical protein
VLVLELLLLPVVGDAAQVQNSVQGIGKGGDVSLVAGIGESVVGGCYHIAQKITGKTMHTLAVDASLVKAVTVDTIAICTMSSDTCAMGTQGVLRAKTPTPEVLIPKTPYPVSLSPLTPMPFPLLPYTPVGASLPL